MNYSKIVFLISFIFASNSFAATAVSNLETLIKPGKYFGSFKKQNCALTFTKNGDSAFIELHSENDQLAHEFTDHDGIIFKEWKGDFMSNYILRNNESTDYSTDSFRIVKNDAYTYVVIEKMDVQNRDIFRNKIECLLK